MSKLSKPITTPCISDTLKAIPLGEQRTFAAVDLGSLATVRVAASRLNAWDVSCRYNVTTDDNGVTMTISKTLKDNI